VPIYRKVNQDFFKTWSGGMAYVLGFFAADGNLIKTKRNTHFFSLEICDLDVLQKIKKLMNADHKIGIRPSKGNWNRSYRLQIGSKEIYADLQQLGFSSKKTFNMTVPKVPEQYLGDFVRGYFDGDGNIWKGWIHKDRKMPILSLRVAFTSSSRIFLTGLKKRLKEFYIEGGSFSDHGSYYRVSYSTRNSLKIYNLMYNCQHYNLYLKRKKDVFDNFIALRP
jgi:hypothetical protein